MTSYFYKFVTTSVKKKAEHTKDSSFGSSAILFIKTQSLPLASHEEIGSV
jgi:hypothetical protein